MGLHTFDPDDEAADGREDVSSDIGRAGSGDTGVGAVSHVETFVERTVDSRAAIYARAHEGLESREKILFASE